MTFGISLKKWKELGMFSREMSYLVYLAKNFNFKSISIFTYSLEDKLLAKEYFNKFDLDVNVIAPDHELDTKFKRLKYSLLAPFSIVLKTKKNLLITNQLKGSWSALIFKALYSGKIILRTGYTLSRFSFKKNGLNLNYYLILIYELFMQRFSDRYVVSSKSDYDYFAKKYFCKKSNIFIAKNFVNSFDIKFNNRDDEILFVGRLSEQKNLKNILHACIDSEKKITVVGDGEQLDLVRALAEKSNFINYKGSLDHQDVIKEMQRCKYYILGSYYEGMPKTLIEALASKCLCICTNISAVKEFSLDDKCIVVDGFSKEDIEKGIKKATNLDIHEYESMIDKAYQYVKKNHSIESFAHSVIGGLND